MYNSYSIKHGKTARYGTGPIGDNEAAALILRAVNRRVPTRTIIKVRNGFYTRVVRFYGGKLMRVAFSDCTAALRRYDSGADHFLKAAEGNVSWVGNLGDKDIPDHILAHMVRTTYLIAENFGIAINPGGRFSY